MKKRLLLLLFAALSLHPIYAYDFEVDDIYYDITSSSNKTCAVTYRNQSNNSNIYYDEIVIPESVTYNGTEYSVTSIGYAAFVNCSRLTEVSIPNSVTEIGHSAFQGCSRLTKVTIPNSVTEIREHTFYDCRGLTSFSIGNSVTEIGYHAFSGCSGLTEVTIPNSVTTIDDHAFHGCSGLTSVTIPNSVTTIGAGAFAFCSSLTEFHVNSSRTYNKVIDGVRYKCHFVVYNGVLYEKLIALDGENINSYQLHLVQYPAGKTNDTFTIPNDVTQIRRSAFEGCSRLTSVTIPNSVTTIGSNAFFWCSGLISVTIPNSVTEIDGYAFECCSGLTSVTIGNSVMKIGEFAFAYCSSLTSVYIPNFVPEIVGGAFAFCSSLTEFHVNTLSTYDKVIDGVKYKCSFAVFDGVLYEALIALDGENINSYQLHLIQFPPGKTNNTFTIPTDVTQIRPYAFYYCNSLTSIEIPNSVATIGNYAFYECSRLTSIEIPNSVTTIGESAFFGCSGLTEVTIPNSVTTIGSYAVYCCRGLTSVTYLAENPIEGYSEFFSDETYEKATLNYLETAAKKIGSTTPWNLFKNRVGRSADFVDTEIEEISGGSHEITEVYNLSGVKVGTSLEGLAKGVYIVRQGAKTTKLAI